MTPLTPGDPAAREVGAQGADLLATDGTGVASLSERRAERVWARLVRRLWIPLCTVLVLLGPVLAFVAYRLEARADAGRAQALVEEALTEKAQLVSERILSFRESLYSLRGLFHASDEVTRDEFATFTQEARARHPFILALEWAPRVEAASRAAHEEKARAGGLPHYRVKGAGGETPSSGDAYPVLYAEPLATNGIVLGFDLASELTRAWAIQRAVASDDAVLTDPIALVQDSGAERSGALLVLPVRTRAPGGSSAPAGVQGVVLAVFRFADLLEPLEHRARRPSADEVRFELVDASVAGRPLLLRALGPEATQGEEAFVLEHGLALAGQEWVLRGRPTDGLLGKPRGLGPSLLGLAVLVAWEVFALLLLTLARSSRLQALHRQGHLVRSVLLSLSDGLIVADSGGRIHLANGAARRIVGKDLVDAPSGAWSKWFSVYEADGVTPCPEERLPLARAMRGEAITGETLFVRNPGAPNGVWVEATGGPIRGESGERRGGVVVLRDVTARRQAEEERLNLHSAVEQTADAVFITDPAGAILYANPAFEVLTGHTRAEALGQTPRILKSGKHDTKHYERLWSVVLHGGVYRDIITNRKKDGTLIVVDQTITPVRDASGRITRLVAVLKDMTERRRIEENAVEMRLAAQVQQGLYPHAPPDAPEFDIAGAVFSAEATSGDYYDYLSMPGNRLGIAVGDVCGHGLPSAIVMAVTRAYLRSSIRTGAGLGESLRQMNGLLHGDLPPDLFVTLLLAELDPVTRRVSWASAGHGPCYVLDARGEVVATLGATGPPLGLFPGEAYRSETGPALVPGHVLLLMTDGAFECANADGRMLEEAGVLEAVRAARGGTADEILRHVHASIRAHMGGVPLRDDVTLVVVKAR